MKTIPVQFGHSCQDENPSRRGHHGEITFAKGFEDGSPVPVPIVFMNADEDKFLDPKLQKMVDEIVKRRVEDEVGKAVWEALTRFALETIQHKNPKLTLTAFCFAAGLYLDQGKSATDLARELGVSKQAFSKRAVKLLEQLDLSPSRGMKSELARQSYKKAHSKKDRNE